MRNSNKSHAIKCHWKALSQILVPFARRDRKVVTIWRFPRCQVEVNKVDCCLGSVVFLQQATPNAATSQWLLPVTTNLSSSEDETGLFSPLDSIKGTFKQLEELRLHSEVSPNPRAQRSGLDFPWPHHGAVVQPCGCSSFISKHVLCNVQHPRGTEWFSHLRVAADGEPLRGGHRAQRTVNGKGQDAFLCPNVGGKKKKKSYFQAVYKLLLKNRTVLLIIGCIHDTQFILLGLMLCGKIGWPNSKYSHAATTIGNNVSKHTLPTQPFRPRKNLHAALYLA